MSVLDWEQKGEFINVFERSLFVIDSNTIFEANNSVQEVLVVLHGYPTSIYDYYKVLPDLAQKYRVIMHDHLGFGFSEKPLDYSYSLIEQADIAL